MGAFIWVDDKEKDNCLLFELKQAEQELSTLLDTTGSLNLEIIWKTTRNVGWPKWECHFETEVLSPTKAWGRTSLLLKEVGKMYR